MLKNVERKTKMGILKQKDDGADYSFKKQTIKY
jgi:hypothetical protein